MDAAAVSPARALRYERVATSTGVRVVLLDGERLPGHDLTAGRWLLRCDQHGTVTVLTTKRRAESLIDRPQAWCPPCQELANLRRRQRRLERLRALSAAAGRELTAEELERVEQADRDARAQLTAAQRQELRADEFVEEVAEGWAATFDGTYVAEDGRRVVRADLT